MRKNLLFLFLSIVGLANAQSLEILSADTVVVGNAYNSFDIYGVVQVKNTSSQRQTYLAKRIDTGYTALTDSNAICWGVCFTPDVSVSPIQIQINSGETYNGFSGHVYPNRDGVPDSGSITYIFYNVADTTDRVVFTMHFEVNQSFSINETESDKRISVFPNPAKGLTRVDYQMYNKGNFTFELYNLLGTRVYGKVLPSANGSFTFDADKYAKGVYFYVIKNEGILVESKKIFIK